MTNMALGFASKTKSFQVKLYKNNIPKAQLHQIFDDLVPSMYLRLLCQRYDTLVM